MSGLERAVLERWPSGPDYGIELAVTTRHGGVSGGPYATLNLGLHVGDHVEHVMTNRQRAAAAFGVELNSLVFAEQFHGANVRRVGPAERGRGTLSMEDAIPSCDVLVTTSPQTTLVMMVADCVPIALIDPQSGVLAVVHAGWRGTAASVVVKGVEAVVDGGGAASRVIAFIGPAVDQQRYEVDRTVLDGLEEAAAPDRLAPEVARDDGPSHWLVDLVEANRQQLQRAGVAAAHIFTSGTTTADEQYFSDRAQRPCGRFALMARLAG